MKSTCFAAIAVIALILGVASPPAEAEEGFTPLFNGKDLDGWVHVNDRKDTWSVQGGMIVTTGKPIGFLRSAKQYENFIMELEWRHMPPKSDAVGNSGIFIWADPTPKIGQGHFTRGIEVQVLVNLEWKDKKTGGVTASSHGD